MKAGGKLTNDRSSLVCFWRFVVVRLASVFLGLVDDGNCGLGSARLVGVKAR